MSRLKALRLVNICQHALFEARLDVGMYAVVGPNGCGKTNILRGLVFGLTGLVDGLWGGKQTLQKDGVSTPGYVEVAFEHEGSDYVVKRWSVAGARFTDTVKGPEGRQAIVGTKNVDAFMEEVFGMPCRLMFQVCWGRQGELAQLLTGTASSISTLLSQVFDTTGLEKVRAAIKNRMDVIASLPVSGQEQLDKAVNGLAALPSDEELDKAVDDAQQERDAADTALRTIEASRKTGETFEKLRLMTMHATHILENDRKALELLPKDAVNPFGNPLVVLEGRRTEVADRLASAQAKIAATESNERIAQTNVDAMVKAIRDLLEQNSAVNEKLDAPSDVCAVCGQPVTDKAAYAKCMCKQLTGFETRAAYETDCRKKHDMYMATKNDQERVLRLALSNKQAFIRERDEAEAELAVLDDAVKCERRKALEAKVADDEARLKEIRAIPVLDKENDDEAYNNAQMEFIKASKALEAATERRTTARTTRKLLTEQKEFAEKLVKQYAVNKEAREILSELRDVFSQNRAQARYLRERIAELNVRLQEFVSNTGMPFTLRLDEEQRLFMYRTADGYEHPAAHLSGAQKAMSAVALQMALFQVMQPNMMLYLIDEPTEALDDENKAVMGRMFHRMRMLMPKVHGTMLVVTRDELVVAGATGTLQAAQ